MAARNRGRFVDRRRLYTILVQLPALLASPPAARGAILPNLVPRQFRYIFRVAEFTILTGLPARSARSPASGDAAAAAQMPLLGARIRRFGYIQLAIGALILLAMVTARFS